MKFWQSIRFKHWFSKHTLHLKGRNGTETERTGPLHLHLAWPRVTFASTHPVWCIRFQNQCILHLHGQKRLPKHCWSCRWKEHIRGSKKRRQQRQRRMLPKHSATGEHPFPTQQCQPRILRLCYMHIWWLSPWEVTGRLSNCTRASVPCSKQYIRYHATQNIK